MDSETVCTPAAAISAILQLLRHQLEFLQMSETWELDCAAAAASLTDGKGPVLGRLAGILSESAWSNKIKIAKFYVVSRRSFLDCQGHGKVTAKVVEAHPKAAAGKMLRRPPAASILLFSSVAYYLPCIAHSFGGSAFSYRF